MGQLPLALFLLIASMCFTTAIMESSFTCKEVERTALLKLKHDFIAYPFGYVTRLDSWVGGDCCSWKGVGCDNATGHVIKLDLRARDDDYTPDGEVNPSLLELKYLRYLDLSGYDFGGSKFPLLFGSMRQLQYLNLPYTYDGGKVPQNLCNLTELVALDLRSWGNMETNSLEWVFKLRNLQYLALSGINMSQAHDSLNILHHLPSLSVLNLASCSLGNSHLVMMRNSTLSSTTLQHLDLSVNNFSGTIPNFIQNLSTIKFLDLSSNQFNSSLPSWFGNKLVDLKHLGLGHNSFTGPFPYFIHNLSFLTSLDLSYNQFSSSIPSWLANKIHLEFISLSNNFFHGVDGGVMNLIASLCDLKHMDLSYNHLQEDILVFDANFSRCSRYDLQYLYMQNNNMSGQLPTIKCMLSLQELDLSYNNFEVIPASFGELFSLESVDLSCNNLVGVIPANIISLSLLVSLNFSYNHLMGPIPMYIGKMRSLESLDLSFNNLSGSIPGSISHISSLYRLNLSFNNLQGQIPTSIQLQTPMDPSIYKGNPHLCGDPLPRKCFPDNVHTVIEDDEEENSKLEKMWFYLVIMLGFATGFWGVIGTLVAKKRWRHAYFLLAEDLADWLYVRVAVKIARAKGGR